MGKALLVEKMFRTVAELKQCMTVQEIQGNRMQTGHLDKPNVLISLILKILNLMFALRKPTGQPLARKILLISLSLFKNVSLDETIDICAIMSRLFGEHLMSSVTRRCNYSGDSFSVLHKVRMKHQVNTLEAIIINTSRSTLYRQKNLKHKLTLFADSVVFQVTR